MIADSRSEHSMSWWRSSGAGDELERAPLEHETSVEVCVIGAGIAGLSVAHGVASEGCSVIVIDDGAIGGGETGQTTAHLVSALDDRYYDIERLHGETGSRLAAASHAAAIDHIESLVRRHEIDCDFRRVDGYLWAPSEFTDRDGLLQKELEAAHRAGLTDVSVLAAPPGILGVDACLRFPNQAQFHPLRYLASLARVTEELGARICTYTRGMSIRGGKEAYVETETGLKIRCRAIVVATNSPVNDRLAMHTKQAAYRTYVVGLYLTSGGMHPALYWDGLWEDQEWYHYVRVAPGQDHDVLIVGGEDHKTGQPPHGEHYEERFNRLIAWARHRFPIAGEVVNRWSGQVLEPLDAMAYIGRNPRDHDNVFIVTGDSGTGMTHGTIAGLMLPDLIAGRDHPWAHLYDPRRITLRSAGKFARETANMAAQYADWVRGGDVAEADRIAPGDGAIIQRGLRKVAAYREHNGELVELSAVCTHLGGVVRWNAAERTWDCPCHGSRFDCHGRVLNGPARSDLEPLTIHANGRKTERHSAEREQDNVRQEA